MLRIPGLSPQKVPQIHKTLGIENLADLESACRDGRVKTSKGLGPALETTILNGIELLRRSGGQRLIHHAGQLLEAAEYNLRRSHPELTRISVAGDYRRGCELVSELALVAQTPEPGKTRVIDLNGEIRVWLADRKRYGAALLFATGSREHLHELQEIANTNGLILTDTGLLRGRRIVPTNTEEQVYAALGLPFIPPELREDEGEVALARARRLPGLVEQNDLHGLLHCHTDFSDGGNTLRLALLHELVPAAKTIAVLTHSGYGPSGRFQSEVQVAAGALGINTMLLHPNTDREIEAAFEAFAQSGAGALLVGPGPFFDSRRKPLVALAAKLRIPAEYETRATALVGGLMSYGASVEEGYRKAGVYAGRILRGEKPVDLPVLLPTKVELLINLDTARKLNLEVPPALLARADEVIE
jgi:hypothetical protein